MWKSSVEIKEILKNTGGIEKLEQLYSLSVFWGNAIYPESYLADKRWSSLLKKTPYGETIINDIIKDHSEEEEADFYLALFAKFSHHDFIFDHNTSDIPGIRDLLEQEVLTEKIRYPYRFGRCLYDRFNNLFQTERVEHLLSEDAIRLLEGTPKGVYQVGNLTIGPLGLIDSLEPRIIYPSKQLPLWHCADTGCNAIHHVTLVNPPTPILRISRATNQQLHDLLGPQSDWKSELKWFHRESRSKYDEKYSTIIELIADCIPGKERTALMTYALKGGQKHILRETISKLSKNRSKVEGSADDIAEKLTPEEQLQILMTLNNSLLIEYIDELVSKKIIKIPLGERRTPKFVSSGRSHDERAELSSLGTRSISRSAVINLSSLIWNAYEAQNIANELEWKLRQAGGKSTRESLFKFIREMGPETTVRDLILSSSLITKSICNQVKLSLTHITANDDVSIERILWKIGFDPKEFDDLLKRLKQRLIDFNEKVLSATPIESENARETIRSSGVNLFVSLEDFLDRFISFNIWLLSDDHFVSNRFHYDVNAARKSVSEILGSPLNNEGVITIWSTKGDNSLGVLLRYLSEATAWIESLEEKQREEVKRSDTELPHYYDDSLRTFPFRHTQLWADSEPSELAKYKDNFLTISRLIQQADLAFIRNGIDHHREEHLFPTADKMLACVVRLQQAIESSDILRYFPKPFWLTHSTDDRYGIMEYTYADYTAKELKIFQPSVAAGLPGPAYEHPVVIAPNNLLGYPNSQLMFWIRERSDYSQYWDGYPIKRKS